MAITFLSKKSGFPKFTKFSSIIFYILGLPKSTKTRRWLLLSFFKHCFLVIWDGNPQVWVCTFSRFFKFFAFFSGIHDIFPSDFACKFKKFLFLFFLRKKTFLILGAGSYCFWLVLGDLRRLKQPLSIEKTFLRKITNRSFSVSLMISIIFLKKNDFL